MRRAARGGDLGLPTGRKSRRPQIRRIDCQRLQFLRLRYAGIGQAYRGVIACSGLESSPFLPTILRPIPRIDHARVQGPS